MSSSRPDHGGNEKERPPTYRAEDARQGEIILRTPLRRAIFISGLAAFLLLALVFAIT